jgi:hypothetical protein
VITVMDLWFLKKAGSFLTSWATISLKMTVFWDAAPCSLAEIYRRFRGSYFLHHQNDEAVSTSETSKTTRRDIPKDSHLHANRRDKLKSRLLISQEEVCSMELVIWSYYLTL